MLKDKIEELNEENLEMKKQIKPKRRYSKRRLNLPKNYKCPREGC